MPSSAISRCSMPWTTCCVTCHSKCSHSKCSHSKCSHSKCSHTRCSHSKAWTACRVTCLPALWMRLTRPSGLPNMSEWPSSLPGEGEGYCQGLGSGSGSGSGRVRVRGRVRGRGRVREVEQLAELPRGGGGVVARSPPSDLADPHEGVVFGVGEEGEGGVGDRGEVREHGQRGLRPSRHLRQQLVVHLQQLADRVLGAILLNGDAHVEDDGQLHRRRGAAPAAQPAVPLRHPRAAHAYALDVHVGERRVGVLVLEDARRHNEALR